MILPMASTSEDRPSTPRARPFRDVALASGLVTAADLDAAQAAALGQRADGSPTQEADGSRRADSATAAVLVEQGKLTAFQAREILAGRTRFRLGQYTVIDEIGRGGMGQVFKAEHALMGRHVAVKVLPRAKATPESEAAFRREMRILGRLDHENLVRAFDAGYDAMVYYLVTELVPGIDLRRQIRTYGPLDEMAAASVFSQVARALSFAHVQGLVHRDVKPGNILVMDDGRAKLLDLGLAGSTLEAEALQLGRVVGTMDYIAPEQIRTPDNVGPTADIYALGCSMYYALTGTVPFPGGSRKDKMRRHLAELPTPLHQLAPHLPRPFCHLVEAMMAKSVADRIGSAEEVIQRLSRWTPDRPTPLSREPISDAMPNGQPGDQQVESSGTERPGDFASAIPEVSFPVFEQRPARRPSVDNAEFGTLVRESLGVMWSSPIGATARRILAPATLAGAGLALVLSLVRAADPRGFATLLGGTSPATCGGVMFLFIAIARTVADLGRRHR